MDGDFRQLVRFFFLGPFLGAAIGILHLSAEIHVWDYHDSLKTLFRNFNDLVLTFIALGIGGCMAGVPFGLALLAAETSLEREIPVTWFVVWASLVSALTSLLVCELRFWKYVEGPFVPELCAFVTSTALAFVLSKCKPDAAHVRTEQGEDTAKNRTSIS